ncbi:MAG: sulfatase [Candidatus Sumerlaeota bacterium]
MSLPRAPGADNMLKTPNLLFFLVDDLGWADVGYNGATYHLTPNIDAFAKKALVFDNAYTMPTCSPARVSLFTGMTAPHTGVYHVENFARTPKKYFKVQPVKSGHFYEKPIEMLGDSMRAAGYVTAYVGKWHVDRDPTAHGFDQNFGGCGRGAPKSYFSPYSNPALADGPDGEYLPKRLLSEASEFIKANKDKAFFLCYAPYLVHRPLQAPKEDIARFEKREKETARHDPTYAAMVEWTDRVFQGVLDTLESEGLAENTVIVFTSDNGINGLVGDATPLRGEKGSCYEGGLRVPTMVYWPGVTEAKHSSALVDIVDWYPTLLSIAGGAAPEHALDGVDLTDVLGGKTNSARDAVYWHMPCYNGSPDHKQIWQTPFSAIRSGRHKLIYFYEDDSLELYDLVDDIGETNNLARTMPEKAENLRKELFRWLKAQNAPLPVKK